MLICNLRINFNRKSIGELPKQIMDKSTNLASSALDSFKVGKKSILRSQTKKLKTSQNVGDNIQISNYTRKAEKDLRNEDPKIQCTMESDIEDSALGIPCTTENGKPQHWEEVLKNLRQMRKNFDAPVDTMGCEKCHDDDTTPETQRFQKLLSLMLSSQTKDQITFSVMAKLREHGCTVDNIIETSDETLGELIRTVGFWKRKVKYIKDTAKLIKEKYNGDIPNSAEELCKLPGVGPKMAHICMNTAWGEVTGIGVDTHVHRICNRLGWVNTNTPEATRKALEKWLPHELWSEVNLLIVGFGQQICRGQKPQCTSCLNNKLCPFGTKYIRNERKTGKSPKKDDIT